MPVLPDIAAYADEMIQWRRHIHTNPELDLDCHETAAFVCERLREFGITEIYTGIATSGVVAVIPGNGDGPVTGLRADMDALPILENSDLPWQSKNEGIAHSCGHDGHTTMLLGAAKYLASTRNFTGQVVLLFQPAEEDSGGGRIMVEEGVMSRFGIERVFALHTWPNIPKGIFQTRPGPMLGAIDDFEIVVTGKGGHAAFHDTVIDPFQPAMMIGQALNSIVARNMPTSTQVTVSLTCFNGGNATNVIPDSVRLAGTIRCLQPEMQVMVRERIKEIAHGQAQAFGASAEVNIVTYYPPVVNDDNQTSVAVGVASDIVGSDSVDTSVNPVLGAEDFAYMLRERPGAFLFLGQGDGPGLHTSKFDFNDDVAPIGASFFAHMIESTHKQ
ncbi:putative hydrolase YxeP [Roseovarius albus]|uniref:Putative hydrolase YxeP n=1 Tax=Roseovarius albus TaxID=1247867 RepID=A0A1X6YRN7_9RHOB|nr:amidohydrolase [Roseovarius albus]SLN29392.1 putative hydrolase YxeP [Roseovarius albus]